MILLTQGNKIIDIVKEVEEVSNGLKVIREDDTISIYAQGKTFTQINISEYPNNFKDYIFENGNFVQVNFNSKLTKYQFRQRMTIQEKAKLEMVDTLLEGEMLEIVKAVLKDFDSAEEINLLDESIEGFKQIMVQSGLFTQERVDEITAIQ